MSARPGVNGLITLSVAADRVQPLSPDGLVEYLLAAGRPRLAVSLPDLRRLPAVAWAARAGLTTLDVHVGGGVVPYAEVQAALEADRFSLPAGHPLLRMRPLTPLGDRVVLNCIAYTFLHPSAVDDAVLGRMAADPGVAEGWAASRAAAAARRPGAHYARMAVAGVPPERVTLQFLLDAVDVWAGLSPALLDDRAAAVWLRGARP